jgi:hypothetical protein
MLGEKGLSELFDAIVEVGKAGVGKAKSMGRRKIKA